MRKIKKIYTNISKKIKQLYIVRLLRSRTEIKVLNEKIGGLEEEKQKLIDMIKRLEADKTKLEKENEKLPGLRIMLEKTDESLRNKINSIKVLSDQKVQLENSLFETQQELARVNIQLELCKDEINDLKSDRYLVRKIPSGRTPNTNKTKVSKPMSSRVTKYMREEHE